VTSSLDALALANRATRGLRAYDPGHDLPAFRKKFGADLVELGSNENSYGASPDAIAAIEAAMADLWRYPDPKGAALKAAIAVHTNLSPEQVILGNGSHELLMLIAQCFADGDSEVVFSEFGFAVFAIATQASGAQAVRVPALAKDQPMPNGHDLAAMASRLGPRTRLVYLANPNNPTGTWFADRDLEQFLAAVPRHAIVVVDEAYFEYVDVPELSSALRFLAHYPNLIVTRTFSKAYALAGLRIGYALTSAAVAGVLERLRESFNVNGLALAAATAALADQAHVEDVCRRTANEREWLAAKLRDRGLIVYPSQTNFLLVDFGRDSATIEKALVDSAVVVRPMVGYGLPNTLRITVGTREENERLIERLPSP
jgi:histidinol-phosphate aminotransferase